MSARTISAGNGNSFGNYELSLTYPVFRKEKTIVAAGIITDWYRNNLSGDSIGLRNLYRLSIPLMLQISLGEKYKLNIIADPSLSSDFEDISSKDFRYNAAIRLARNKKTGMLWSAGIGISKQFFGIQVVPFYQANIPITSRLSFSGALPMKPRLTIEISPEKQVGFAVAASAGSFRLSAAKDGQYADIKQGEAFFFYQQKLAGNFHLGINAGRTFINRIRVFGKDQKIPLRLFLYDFGHERTPSASWNSNGWLVQAQVAYKIHSNL
ncbi:MAG: hypothetical protein HC905_10315 [Bacteroidales bacterium]|nr:hypothetical protein [Bacteroidales bacterium]